MAAIVATMTDETELTFRDYVKSSRMTRLELGRRLAEEVGYEGDPAKLKPSIDSYLAGNRPGYERARALDVILNAEGKLLDEWWPSRPTPQDERLEKLQERVDELEARLEDVLTETTATVERLRSALAGTFPELARQLEPPPDGNR